jgi:NADH pyrophosphatase NudC (nudix superfamily)
MKCPKCLKPMTMHYASAVYYCNDEENCDFPYVIPQIEVLTHSMGHILHAAYEGNHQWWTIFEYFGYGNENIQASEE